MQIAVAISAAISMGVGQWRGMGSIGQRSSV